MPESRINNTIYFDKDGKKFRPNVSDSLGYKMGNWVKQNVQVPNVDPDIEKTFFGGNLPKTIGAIASGGFRDVGNKESASDGCRL